MSTQNGVEKTRSELEYLLKTSFGQDVIVVDTIVGDLLALGENFASCMKKVTATIRRNKSSPEETYHLVLKKSLDDCEDVGDIETLTKKEVFFYTEIIPFYTKIESEYYGPDENGSIADIVPKFYGHRIISNDNNVVVESVILLENVKANGFYVLPKKNGLDLNHTKKAIIMLAKFHAIGIVAKKKHPEEFEKIKSMALIPGLYDTHGSEEFRKDFLSNVMKNDSRYNKDIDLLVEIEERHRNNQNYEMTTNDPWSTVCHADYWTTNIMFHKDQDGKVDDLKFIDFQTYCFSNIFTDLCHFLCTSLDDETVSKHFDEMIDLYYESFVSYLKKMKVDVAEFSRSEFDEQFRKDAPYELIHNLIALLYHTVDADGVEDEKELIDIILSCKGNSIFYKKLPKVLEIYERKKWIH